MLVLCDDLVIYLRRAPFFFFCSSRRRHTTSLRDWSSDVCSSDLPCHGSKYNEAGEYQLGPAPTGLNRFKLTVTGNAVSVDTSTIVPGPPRGTNTTHQSPEGPF